MFCLRGNRVLHNSSTSEPWPENLVFRFDARSHCDRHRQRYYRIARELSYDPADVCEVRVTETAIEVDAIDFDDPAWPVITRRFEAT